MPSTAPRWPAPAAFSMAGYIGRQNAKYGRLGVRLSAHHARAARHDMRRRRRHHHHHRKGQRPAVPAPDDRGAPGGRRGRHGRCGLRRRQELQRHRGRRAVIDSKLNARVKGFNAGAEMPGFPRGVPGDLPPDAQPSGQGRAGTGRSHKRAGTACIPRAMPGIYACEGAPTPDGLSRSRPFPSGSGSRMRLRISRSPGPVHSRSGAPLQQVIKSGNAAGDQPAR